MFDQIDIDNIEGGADQDTSEVDYYGSIQKAINDGLWGLQGSYGRTMMGAIECGACLLGKTAARGYWGNHIPSRDEVQPGTKGSYAFVADTMGDSWAELMASV